MKTFVPIEAIKPVMVLINPVTNKDHEMVLRDYRKVSDILEAIEVNFLNRLFNECDELSYGQLYLIHLEMYQKVCLQLERQKKLRYIMLNKRYFHELFAPVEG